jgi:beta-N-acetylhexosaminidase
VASESPPTATLGPVLVDIAGMRLTDAERQRLRHPLVGGVILFSRNFADRAQLIDLCAEISSIRHPRLLIAVDHEGGRVQRFREGFTAIPPMRTLGELWDRDPEQACAQAFRIGRTIGRELTEVGIDLSFTPVLDLDHGRSSVIGHRAFHRHPRTVAALSRSLCHGLLDAGMAHCAKHFPGHGYAEADSHLATAVDERSLDQILADDAAPYAWLADGLRAVMPAHVIYPQVDTSPAGFSARWLREILRGRLGFSGLIFSDDLSMAAAEAGGDVVQRAHAALHAGCDMVLLCNRPDEAERLLGELQWHRPDGFDGRLRALFRR